MRRTAAKMSVSCVKGDCFEICYTTQKNINAQTCQAVEPGVYGTDEWFRLRVFDSGHVLDPACSGATGIATAQTTPRGTKARVVVAVDALLLLRLPPNAE